MEHTTDHHECAVGSIIVAISMFLLAIFIALDTEARYARGEYDIRNIISCGIAVLGCLGLSGYSCRHMRREFKQARLKFREENGLCPGCGYDIRATPDQCPECGTIPQARPQPNS